MLQLSSPFNHINVPRNSQQLNMRRNNGEIESGWLAKGPRLNQNVSRTRAIVSESTLLLEWAQPSHRSEREENVTQTVVARSHKAAMRAGQLVMTQDVQGFATSTNRAQVPITSKRQAQAVLKQDLHLISTESEVERSTTRHGLQPSSRASSGDSKKTKTVAQRTTREELISHQLVQLGRER